MKNKKLLIDSSLTGGRGPAKQAYEFATSCDERGIKYEIITNKSFLPKLKELGLKANYIVDSELSDDPKLIYQKFESVMKEVDFDVLVKFGARTASTYTASKLGKPFFVVDGGLPDKLEDYPSLYAKGGYLDAKSYLLTTHFPWKYPKSSVMNNIELSTYPTSRKTIDYIKDLRDKSKDLVRKELSKKFPELSGKYDLVVHLVMTDDYVAKPEQRKTYGAWLTARQFDQVVGFLRRFVTDLAIQFDGSALVLMDKNIAPVVGDLFDRYQNVTVSHNREDWDYYTEIKMSKVADILVSRATNYVPNIALLGHGGLITTPVPADGYMDEDTAADQAEALGLTELIPYDDEQYMSKLIAFSKDEEKMKKISQNLVKVSDEMLNERNSVDLIIDRL